MIPLGMKNAHHDVWLLLPCAMQVVCAFLILSIIAEQRSAVVRLACLGRWASPFHRLCRLVAGLAYVGAIFGASVSGLAILGSLTGAASWELSQAQNDFGVMISRNAGAIILFHVAGLVWVHARCVRSR